MGKREEYDIKREMVKAAFLLVILILVLSLSGCCSWCPKEVCPIIPVPTKPLPPPDDAFVRPELYLSLLKPDATDSEVIRAYVLSTDMLINHSLYLERLLTGYK